MAEVMDAINREAQSQTWGAVSSAVCAIEVVKNRGIHITCTNRDLAIKIGGTAISCMGQQLVVKPYSAYDRLYYVDLTHIPPGRRPRRSADQCCTAAKDQVSWG
ncbi:hypothetical protein PRIC1_010647 [Phytophthora ramorum]|uniref:Uncharacterized protein n=1 Tax=Phytophthora ramorum TaxID=164328 RepID=H3H2W9_PHYRM|nr:hypothetical protein KRP23_3073 [Phytophthora ramorum]KAH7495418.1 hypothetical protein KRP22_15028 [Phytophthora ramorum]